MLVTGGTGPDRQPAGRRPEPRRPRGDGADARRAQAAAFAAPIRIVTALEQIADDARIDAIVNLAGEPLADGLWTCEATPDPALAAAGDARGGAADPPLTRRPRVLVSGSAIGWYGLRGTRC